MFGWNDYENSFHGNIEGFEDISVDNFYNKTKKAYFLSHFHSDHYGGLVGSFGYHASYLLLTLPKCKKIYMTEPTRLIFSKHYLDDYNKLEHIIVTLRTGQTYSNLDGLGIDVTLQEVTHMPGAVMFIFAKPSWRVLYTGDFVMRTSGEEELAEFKSLHDEDGSPLTFDYMYYDAAFEEKPTLPTRAQCIEKVVPIIKDWLNLSEENAVVFMTYYNYAYEELFAEISRRMEQKKIYIPDYKQIEVYNEILNAEQNVFTSESSTSRIFRQYGKDYKRYELPSGKKYLTIAVATRTWENEMDSIVEFKTNIYEMCFPTHCTKTQLDVFKNYFQATNYIGFRKLHD